MFVFPAVWRVGGGGVDTVVVLLGLAAGVRWEEAGCRPILTEPRRKRKRRVVVVVVVTAHSPRDDVSCCVFDAVRPARVDRRWPTKKKPVVVVVVVASRTGASLFFEEQEGEPDDERERRERGRVGEWESVALVKGARFFDRKWAWAW